jgi:hypothetical protein
MTITRKQLLAVKKLLKDATPGPWTVIPDSRPDIVTEQIWGKTGGVGYEDGGQLVKDFDRHMTRYGALHVAQFAKYWGDDNGRRSGLADAALVVALRNIAPQLIDELLALKKEKQCQK